MELPESGISTYSGSVYSGINLSEMNPMINIKIAEHVAQPKIIPAFWPLVTFGDLCSDELMRVVNKKINIILFA